MKIEDRLEEYLVQLRRDSAEVYREWKRREDVSILDAPTKYWKGYYACMLDTIIDLENILSEGGNER